MYLKQVALKQELWLVGLVSSCRSISCEELLSEVLSTSNCFKHHSYKHTNRYAYVYATLPLKTFKLHIYTYAEAMIYTHKNNAFSHMNVYTLCLVLFNQSHIATGFESERTRQQEMERMCVCAFKPREDVKLLYWKTEWKGKIKERSCVRAVIAGVGEETSSIDHCVD